LRDLLTEPPNRAAILHQSPTRSTDCRRAVNRRDIVLSALGRGS
jgi:hypothetical protein